MTEGLCFYLARGRLYRASKETRRPVSSSRPMTSALAYIVVDSADRAGWREFGTQVLGAQADDQGDDLHLRIDDRPFRAVIRPSEEDRFASAGWELRDAAAFASVLEALEAESIDYTVASPEDAYGRKVGGLARLSDPSGNPLELVHTPLLANTRFVSPVGVSAFVTGSLGMGHVVLPAVHFDETHDFYTRILGFRMTDRMQLGRGEGGMRLQFYHCNERHHSLALMEAPHPAGLVHVMLEVPDVDGVGYALDRCVQSGVELSATLGRHTNDQMISFYLKSPSGFDIEFGCEGMRLDLDHVSPSEITSVSHWGHDFSVGFRADAK